MSTAYSGVDGKLKSGAVDMDVGKWTAKISVAEVDTSTTADAGWSSTHGWVKSLEGSGEFNFTEAKNPFGAAQGLTPGLTASLELHITTSKKITGNFLITSVDVTSEYKGAIKGMFAFKSQGVVTLPT